MLNEAFGPMVVDEFENQSVQTRMVWRRHHPRGGPVSSGFVVATTFAPTPVWSLGGSPKADTDCGLHRLHLKNETCAGFVVDGWQVWFPHSTS